MQQFFYYSVVISLLLPFIIMIVINYYSHHTRYIVIYGNWISDDRYIDFAKPNLGFILPNLKIKHSNQRSADCYLNILSVTKSVSLTWWKLEKIMILQCHCLIRNIESFTLQNELPFTFNQDSVGHWLLARTKLHKQDEASSLAHPLRHGHHSRPRRVVLYQGRAVLHAVRVRERDAAGGGTAELHFPAMLWDLQGDRRLRVVDAWANTSI